MNLALQVVVVGLLVGACLLYSTWRLLSARLRLRTLEALARLPVVGRAAWLAALRARVLAGMGGCAGCAAPSAASRNQTPGALRR